MSKLLPQWFKSKQKTKGCIVIVGNAVQQLSQLFVGQVQCDAMPVYQLQHDATKTQPQIEAQVEGLIAVRLNLLDVAAVKSVIQKIQKAGHFVDLCIFQPDFVLPENNHSLSAEQLENYWQNTGLTAVNIAQTVIRQMLSKQQGTLIFLGTQQPVESEQDLFSQSMSASIRALAQSLAREFHPKGIHVVYCVVPHGQTAKHQLMQSLQQTCWHLYQQPKSTWSQELRLGL
ncbi:SDR family NAD(P)-dependent oxidoreductase [Acinetobacter sp. C26M]|uniref:SDR family NAD(P)-dependent oxidoreductase n=1 Tax=unclassified Acinetobacter TaxID=196816 RepID=UPI0020367A43|nr:MULTISPECIES: SDR family NAD(P)-dependent oxidoreductase [unclassified Acinetobacter]USA47479.1 SDR family NAD(P)-dependent oxidoreductase [Acinetobacter sp. C26M]USA50960.1 SDR family NAD(P)-dependent oxidoreductase [Acinetobacter sp. C26G]